MQGMIAKKKAVGNATNLRHNQKSIDIDGRQICTTLYSLILKICFHLNKTRAKS